MEENKEKVTTASYGPAQQTCTSVVRSQADKRSKREKNIRVVASGGVHPPPDAIQTQKLQKLLTSLQTATSDRGT